MTCAMATQPAPTQEQAPSPEPVRPAARPRTPGQPGLRVVESGGDRRSAAPRSNGAMRGSLINAQWCLMAPTMIAALALAMLAAWHVPSWPTFVLTGIAAGIAAVTGPYLRFERRLRERPAAQMLGMAAIVGLPMVLFGAAMGQWASAPEGVAASQLIGVIAIVSAILAVLLNGRVAAILTASVLLWTPAGLFEAEPGSIVVTATGLAAAAYFAVRQAKIDRVADQARRQRERALTRAEEILSDYEQTGQGWFWETDRRGTITYVSATVGAVLGRDSAQLVGKPLTELFVLDAAEGERTLAFHLSARSSFQELAVRAATSGEERWWSITGRPVFDSFTNFVGFRGSGTDLTEKRRSQENASRLAHYDSLTGLANRFQMSQTLEKILAAPRIENRACAVFLLDLDRFKQVNDTLGHPAGDALLKQVSERLEWTVDKYGRVGRLGGDEFKVIVPGAHRHEDIAVLAERIIANLSEAYIIDGQRVVIGASIGIALSPADGVTSEALIRNADLALYAAKAAGRGKHCFYEPAMHSDLSDRQLLEDELRQAIERGQLWVAYQPIIRAAAEELCGFEALVRWSHPVRGPISPDKFIPLAEECGLISDIGQWVLKTALQEAAHWPDQVLIAVNLSPIQFNDPATVDMIAELLQETGVRAARLELEITEGVFLAEGDSTDDTFAKLKGLGVRLALDDFGTGYSSLGYLKKAPFDKIKIDQSFVRGAASTTNRNSAIIRAIVTLAETLGMDTTAEGVETHDDLHLIRELGVSQVQGYIFGRPAPADEARKLANSVTVEADGYQCIREPRQRLMRRAIAQIDGEVTEIRLRNISSMGALVECPKPVLPGTVITIDIVGSGPVLGTVRWAQSGKFGVQFSDGFNMSRLAPKKDRQSKVTMLRPWYVDQKVAS